MTKTLEFAHVMPLAKAEEFVNLLNTTEDACGWTYNVNKCHGGTHACIEVHGETCEFIGYLSH